MQVPAISLELRQIRHISNIATSLQKPLMPKSELLLLATISFRTKMLHQRGMVARLVVPFI
jgi:hypothetical protein